MDSPTIKKNRATDIILVLKPKEGGPKNKSGTVDNRLFSGNNNLHAVMNTQNCLWTLQMDHGLIPGGLQQSFTGFTPLLKYVTDYYNRRNVEIAEIID